LFRSAGLVSSCPSVTPTCFYLFVFIFLPHNVPRFPTRGTPFPHHRLCLLQVLFPPPAYVSLLVPVPHSNFCPRKSNPRRPESELSCLRRFPGYLYTFLSPPHVSPCAKRNSPDGSSGHWDPLLFFLLILQPFQKFIERMVFAASFTLLFSSPHVYHPSFSLPVPPFFSPAYFPQ